MMKCLFSLVLGLTLSAMSAMSALAQEDTPDALIKNVTEEVLSIIRQDKGIQSGDTRKVIELVDAKVLPHFNFQRMTALAMGREWNKANPDQKKQLVEEFQTLLVRTYSNALTGYKDQTVRYKPTKMPNGDGDVVVKTEIMQPGGKPIQLDYSLGKTPEGWKVFDMIVAGVSLVTNYRDTFTTEVRANGVDSLIKMLSDKNKQLEAGKK
jgi:phospholipid transport system substrate-binding protein